MNESNGDYMIFDSELKCYKITENTSITDIIKYVKSCNYGLYHDYIDSITDFICTVKNVLSNTSYTQCNFIFNNDVFGIYIIKNGFNGDLIDIHVTIPCGFMFTIEVNDLCNAYNKVFNIQCDNWLSDKTIIELINNYSY